MYQVICLESTRQPILFGDLFTTVYVKCWTSIESTRPLVKSISVPPSELSNVSMYRLWKYCGFGSWKDISNQLESIQHFKPFKYFNWSQHWKLRAPLGTMGVYWTGAVQHRLTQIYQIVEINICWSLFWNLKFASWIYDPNLWKFLINIPSIVKISFQRPCTWVYKNSWNRFMLHPYNLYI